MSDPNWCPICNHRAHGHELPGCTESANRPVPCGCTFSYTRMLEGEASARAGRVRPFWDVIGALRSRVP